MGKGHHIFLEFYIIFLINMYDGQITLYIGETLEQACGVRETQVAGLESPTPFIYHYYPKRMRPIAV
jgi:hypothetical protein